MADKTLIYLRTDSIGDAVMAGSMLPYLKQALPDYSFVAICQNPAAPIYEKCPYIDRTLSFEKQRFLTEEVYRTDFARLLAELRAEICLNSVYSRDVICDFLVTHCQAERRIGHVGDTANLPADQVA